MFQLLKCLCCLVLLVLAPTAQAQEAVTGVGPVQSEWKVSVGGGLIVAPAFVGARTYSLLAVPNIRVNYKDLFFANVRDGIGYALVNSDGWRIGPVVSYTFARSEKDGGSIFRVAGGGKSALQGMVERAVAVVVRNDTASALNRQHKPKRIIFHLIDSTEKISFSCLKL